MTPLRLVLFVRGNTPRSASAIRAVKGACSGRSSDARSLQVVDVCQEPALVSRYNIVATPTLLTIGEAGERRWVGEVGEAQLQDCFAGEPYGQ